MLKLALYCRTQGGCQDSTLYVTGKPVSNVLNLFYQLESKGLSAWNDKNRKRNIYSKEDPVRIIKRRFTKGKISEEEYEELKKAIES